MPQDGQHGVGDDFVGTALTGRGSNPQERHRLFLLAFLRHRR
jgi:hypothetical protein